MGLIEPAGEPVLPLGQQGVQLPGEEGIAIARILGGDTEQHAGQQAIRAGNQQAMPLPRREAAGLGKRRADGVKRVEESGKGFGRHAVDRDPRAPDIAVRRHLIQKHAVLAADATPGGSKRDAR